MTGLVSDGRLLLADPAERPDRAALAALLDRTGLLAGNDGDADARLRLRFGGLGFTLDLAPDLAPDDAPSAGDMQAIGGVATSMPGLAMALTLDPTAAVSRVAGVQRLCALAAMLAELTGATRLYWPPARLWSPVAALVEAVAAGERDGLPPVLHLIAFRQRDAAMTTRGLAFFCGVELCLTSDAPLAVTAMVQRLARLAVHAMLVGPLAAGAEVEGLEPGETLRAGRAERVGEVPVIPVHAARRR